MATHDEELESFKVSINLAEFAASRSYRVDQKASSRNSVIMVSSSGNKVVIAKGHDNHWIYFSVRDQSDCGSIIDFLQNRGGGSLGNVRSQLRPWLSGSHSPPLLSTPDRGSLPRDLVPIERDIAAVRARYEEAEVLSGEHPYLTEERCIPVGIISDERFSRRIRCDNRGNVVFPHFNLEGLCGFELKNRQFTGFSKGGAKGLWASSIKPDDRTLVIAESAIDALSYAALFGYEETRFISLAGQVSPEQVELVASAMRRLEHGQVVLAFDNDDAGDQLVEKFSEVFTRFADSLVLRIDRPDDRGADWNDIVRG